jgi:hypothetical protein
MMRSVLLFFCLSISLTAFAGIYKWVDRDGHAHYSDQPPSDRATAIKNAPEQSDQAIASKRELADKDLAFRKRQEEAAKAKEKADKDAESARIKRETCARARSNLAAMDGNKRIYTTGLAGQRQYMSDQQKLDAHVISEKAVADNCR